MRKVAVVVGALMAVGCSADPVGSSAEEVFEDIPCTLVTDGFGPGGAAPIDVEVIASGLEVPWGVAFLPDGDALVTERPGRIRLIRGGELIPEPVATISIPNAGTEGGLLGIALHPDFPAPRDFFVYTAGAVNEVQRWTLGQDARSAQLVRVVLGDIPSADFHSGGRLRVGPDDLLYVSTGDAKQPELAQDVSSLAGKILRITPEGEIPADNPFAGLATFVLGIRNSQGFDWASPERLYVSDHGPTGEFLLTGQDEISLASPGANLGWPRIHGCQTRNDLLTPSIAWDSAVPPGGAAVYSGGEIPEWTGALLVTTLGAEHLQVVHFDPQAPRKVTEHSAYLYERYGRLREVVTAPDGSVWVSTSNCDSYGVCPPEKDRLLRITRQ